MNHLIETGRTKIMMLIPEKFQHLQCIKDRCEGYKEALRRHNLPITAEYIRTVRCIPQAVDLFIRELRCLQEIDAIFCTSDELAALCLRSLQALGKKIPEEIALIGFNNSPIAEHTTPPLSSVHWPIEAQANAAIDLLLKILKKEIPYEPGFHEIETHLVIRESSVK
jgi:LacI family transcriptional regulator